MRRHNGRNTFSVIPGPSSLYDICIVWWFYFVTLSLSLSLSLCPYLLLYFLSVCCYMPIYLSLSVSGTMNLPISISLSPYLALCLIAFTHFFPFSCNIFLSIRFLGFRYILCPPSLLLSVSIFEWTNLQFLLIHLCLRNMKGNRHR